MDMTLGHTEQILESCKKHSLLRNQAAYVLATAKWETAHTMKPVVEAFWLSENWRKRNLRYYPWHGRGFVQLTWERNYKRATKELGVSLDKNPDLALDPKIAAEVLVVGCKEGWFTGKKLDDYITLWVSDFKNARRVVNGTDKASEIARLAKDYDTELKAMGYGEVPEVTTPEPTPAKKSKGFLAFLISLFRKGKA